MVNLFRFPGRKPGFTTRNQADPLPYNRNCAATQRPRDMPRFSGFLPEKRATDTGKDGFMQGEWEPLRIKIRGEDGYRVTTIRIPADVLERAEDLAIKAHLSRNKIISMVLEHGLENIIVEDMSKPQENT